MARTNTSRSARAAPKGTRLTRERELHQRLRDFALLASRRVASPLNVSATLAALAQDTNALLGAHATAVWLHDRQTRELVLAGSSSPENRSGTARVPVEDSAAPAARGLRLDRPAILSDLANPVLVAPLRGWRRALGTLVVEGPCLTDLDNEQRNYFVHEMASQLSVVVENLQLLEQILSQRRLLENTFNSLIDLVVVADNDLRIVETNNAFADRVRLSKKDLVGRRLEELTDVAVFQRIANHAESDDDGGHDTNRVQTFEAPLLGGTFVVTVTPLLREAGDLVGRVIVARDISLQAQLEAERGVLRERLAQSEKLASLGQFVAGIAHEMNNPLQGVLGHLELMMRKPKDVLPVRSDLRRVYQDARRAARVVRNLLVFSGTRRVVRRRMQIGRVWTRALASRRAALTRHRIAVVRRDGESVPPVMGDPVLLQEAFLNVLINAEHAIAEAGAEGTIEIGTAVSADGTVVIATIRDTGPGIPPDVLPRVFDPFFTTKEVGKGTGLGLAITYGILQEHGGRIHAQNSTEGGAVFTLELPAARATDPRPKTQDPRPKTQDPRPKTQDPRPETRDPRPETRDPRPETRD